MSGGELHPCEELLCRDWGQQLLSVDRIHGFGWHEHLRLRVRELRLGNGEVRATHTRTGWQVANSDHDPMRARAAGRGENEEPAESREHAHDAGDQPRIQPAPMLSLGFLRRQSDRRKPVHVPIGCGGNALHARFLL